ncbi:hypothetical protein OSB04_001145, partial [Centaurea solstitialis]
MLGLNHTSICSHIIHDYASLSAERRWLLSAFSGVLMCKVVIVLELLSSNGDRAYEFTGIITSLVFKSFVKLSNANRLEWKNRGFSTFHALFVVVASVYFLLVSDLFDESIGDGLIIKRSSTLSETVLGMSCGYFLSDMAMIIWTFPTLGGLEYILHHGLSMFAIMQSVLNGEAQFYIFMVLFTESTTPFVNIRWYLDVAGMKASKLYVWNGIAMFLGWLVARILLFAFFFYHVYTHLDEMKQLHKTAYYSLHIIPPMLAVMNLYWFYKITKGM